VRRDNPAARRLYASLGFVPAGGDMLAEQMVWPAR
jgi:predicted GNAT family acetyltransferase